MRRFAVLLSVFMLFACSKPAHDPIPAGSTVLILGDSISYGTGANKGEDYPTLLAARTGWNVINAGVPGDTSAGGLERLPDLLEEHAPKFVIVELGGNDFLQQQASSQVASNLKSILSEIKSRDIPATMIAVPSFSPVAAAVGNLSDSPIYRQVGEETQTPVVEDILAEVLSKNSLKADPIHPNATGYRKFEEALAEALKDLGFLG